MRLHMMWRMHAQAYDGLDRGMPRPVCMCMCMHRPVCMRATVACARKRPSARTQGSDTLRSWLQRQADKAIKEHWVLPNVFALELPFFKRDGAAAAEPGVSSTADVAVGAVSEIARDMGVAMTDEELKWDASLRTLLCLRTDSWAGPSWPLDARLAQIVRVYMSMHAPRHVLMHGLTPRRTERPDRARLPAPPFAPRASISAAATGVAARTTRIGSSTPHSTTPPSPSPTHV